MGPRLPGGLGPTRPMASHGLHHACMHTHTHGQCGVERGGGVHHQASCSSRKKSGTLEWLGALCLGGGQGGDSRDGHQRAEGCCNPPSQSRPQHAVRGREEAPGLNPSPDLGLASGPSPSPPSPSLSRLSATRYREDRGLPLCRAHRHSSVSSRGPGGQLTPRRPWPPSPAQSLHLAPVSG